MEILDGLDGTLFPVVAKTTSIFGHRNSLNKMNEDEILSFDLFVKRTSSTKVVG